MGQLISVEALSNHGADCIFDCGFSLSDADLGRQWFESGHIDVPVHARTLRLPRDECSGVCDGRPRVRVDVAEQRSAEECKHAPAERACK